MLHSSDFAILWSPGYLSNLATGYSPVYQYRSYNGPRLFEYISTTRDSAEG